eukprot:s322_g8.t3
MHVVPGLAPMHGFAGRLELQFPSPLTWQSRCAPRVRNVSPVSWKGRATKHREACPVLQGQRPPRPQRIQYSPTAPVEVAYDLSSVPEPPPLNCSEGGVDDEDGDVHGVLSRVELSRYIARKNESLAALAEESRLQKQRAALGDGDWQGEVPGAHSDLNPGLEDAAAWRLVLEALSFERKHFKRGSSNTWPDGFLSPACLSSRDELLQLDAELTSLLPRFDAMDAPVCEDSLRALPAAVFMRQLLSDLRLALGNLHGAAVALAISKSAEPESADPLRPLLLIAWEDALDCDFLKAHHCFRLGRLAIISANAELLVAQELRNASPTKLQLRRAADHETAAANAALAVGYLGQGMAWLGLLSSFRQTVRAADLRFASAENELRFRHDLVQQSFRLAAPAGLTQVALQLVIAANRLSQEMHWSAGMSAPDLIFLLMQASAAVLMVLACLHGLFSKGETCRGFSEALWTCAISANTVAGVLHGRWELDCLDGEASELSAVLLSIAFVSIACHVLPLRCCFLGPLVILAGVACCFQAVMGATASQGRQSGVQLLNAALLLWLLTSSYCAAHGRERSFREGWMRACSQEPWSAVTDFRICSGSLQAAKTFFGKDVEGSSFLMLVDEAYRDNFSQLCKHIDGSRIPRSVTVKLILADPAPTACQLILLYHGRPGRTYLLGIRRVSGFAEQRRSPPGRVQPDPEVQELQQSSRACTIHDAAVDRRGPGQTSLEDTRHPLAPDHVEKDRPAKMDRGSGGPPIMLAYSGFSSDRDGASSASLCYTSSSDGRGSSGFSLLFAGTDGTVQTDPMLGKADACVETDVVWSEGGFHCRCCSLPPCPLDDQQRDALACSNFKPRRRKRKHSSLEVLQGTWALEPSFSSIAQQFMHRLTFIGDRCMDALGQRWKITDDNGTLYLIKGRIWVSGNVLFREGKSGIVMRFQREEAEQVHNAVCIFCETCDGELRVSRREDLAMGFEEDMDAEDVQEQDSLQVLENIVSRCYDEHSPDLLLELGLNQPCSKFHHAARLARRLLQDAHRLFEEQIALHGQEGLHQKTLDMEEEWGISLRCGLLMTMLTQVQAFELLNRIDDKERTLSAAIKLSISLQAEREASPRLQRLLAKLRSELLEMKSAAPQHLNARDVVHPCPHPGPCLPDPRTEPQLLWRFQSGSDLMHFCHLKRKKHLRNLIWARFLTYGLAFLVLPLAQSSEGWAWRLSLCTPSSSAFGSWLGTATIASDSFVTTRHLRLLRADARHHSISQAAGPGQAEEGAPWRPGPAKVRSLAGQKARQLLVENPDEMNDSNVDTESTRLRDRIDLEQQSREAAMEQLTIFIQQAVTTVSNRMEELALTHAESQRQQHSQMRALSQLVTDTQQAQQKQVIRLSRLEELRKGDLQRIEEIEADQKRLCQTLQRLTEDAQHRSNQVNEALRGIAQDVTSLEQFCRNRRRPSKTDTVNGSDGGASIPTLVASEQGLFGQRTDPVISSVAEDGPLKLKTQTVQPSSSMEVASTKVRTTASSSPASSPGVIATPAESEPALLKLEPASHPTQATQPFVAQATPGRLFTPESRRVSMENGKLADWMAARVARGAEANDPLFTKIPFVTQNSRPNDGRSTLFASIWPSTLPTAIGHSISGISFTVSAIEPCGFPPGEARGICAQPTIDKNGPRALSSRNCPELWLHFELVTAFPESASPSLRVLEFPGRASSAANAAIDTTSRRPAGPCPSCHRAGTTCHVTAAVRPKLKGHVWWHCMQWHVRLE